MSTTTKQEMYQISALIPVDVLDRMNRIRESMKVGNDLPALGSVARLLIAAGADAVDRQTRERSRARAVVQSCRATDLTDRQSEVLATIRTSIEERGIPPTLREIGKAVGIGSTNGVNDHLSALVRKGYITRDPMQSRAIRLTERAQSSSELRIEPTWKLLSDEQRARVLGFAREVLADKSTEAA